MRRKSVIHMMLGLVITAFLALSASTFTIAWFSGFGGQTKGNVNGEIGLRGYFHCGSGDINDRYVITRPAHLYNLARLQNRGVFPDKRYFQIGYVFSESEGPVCLDDNGNHVKVLDMTSYCNDRNLPPIGSEGTPFCSEIDGSGIPIVGLKVEGNPEDVGVFGYVDSRGVVDNMIFKNLEVKSVGYSDGSDSSSDHSDDLFDRKIDDLFDHGSQVTFGKASLTWTATLATDAATIETKTSNLKNTSGFPMNNINAVSNLVKDESENPTTTVIGYFKKQDPALDEGNIFTYDWHSSSDLVKKGTFQGEEVMYIDLAEIATGEFNSGGRMKCNTRISLTASTVYNGIKYSRVIQSYNIEFYSNATLYSQGQYSAVVYCDYVDDNPKPGEHPTNYHHGYNVGLVAGHVDGSMSDCYVYNGTLLFNGVDGNTPIPSESETGLVGEIGVNVRSPINPTFGEKEFGDTGVMNFSGIYSTIRRDFKQGDETETRRAYPYKAVLNQDGKGVHFENGNITSCIVYDLAKTEDTKFNKFAEYLRRGHGDTAGYVASAGTEESDDAFEVTNTSSSIKASTTVANATVEVDEDTFKEFTEDTVGGHYEFFYEADGETPGWKLKRTAGDVAANLASYGITLAGGTPLDENIIAVDLTYTTNASNYNSVDFLWNNLIEDEKDEDGKMVVDRGLGIFKIATQFNGAYKWMTDNGQDPLAAGCYLDGIGASKIINGKKQTKVYYSTAECDRRKSPKWEDVSPLRMSTIPSYSDVDSFGYPFSRDFNYCFEMDLAERNKPVGKNYFYNAKGFLSNYFQSILIDEDGIPMSTSDERFGFMVCDSLGNPIDGLSSYMEVDKPGDFRNYATKEDPVYYPSNSIVFKIDATGGANISVIASDANVSVYRNWKNDATGKPVGATDLEELYTMRSNGLEGIDSHRFFKYTLHAETTVDNPTGDPVANGTGLAEPQEGDMVAGDALYAHTFKLDKGEYVLGAAQGASKKAKVYYLAVQGQDDANLGRNHEIYMGQGVENVDFLVSDPVPDVPPAEPLAYVKGSTTRGGVALSKAEFSFKGAFNTHAGGLRVQKKDGEYCVQLIYNGSFSPPNDCTKSLLGYCRKATPRYYFNDTAITETLHPWPALP